MVFAHPLLRAKLTTQTNISIFLRYFAGITSFLSNYGKEIDWRRVVLNSLGIRVASNIIYYTIVKGDVESPNLIVYDKLLIPKAFKEGQAFSWLRSSILNICKEYDIANGIIRTFEANARMSKTAILERSRLEGVIAEALYSYGVKSKICMLATISSLLKIEGKKSAKEYLTSTEFRTIENWDDYIDYTKESTIAAIAALGL